MGEETPAAPVRRVVLGVTGSIAAYKAAEIVRLLQRAGVEVHCILTASGAEFITPLTLGTLSGHPVTTGMFEETTGGPYMTWSGGSEAADAPAEAGAGAASDGSRPGGAARPGAGPGGAAPGGIRHIEVSRASDLLLVAPASANILGKVAHGIADDSLSTAIMASSAPVIFAPAMNTRMWESAATQANMRLLVARGFLFVPPGTGELACGEFGTGRMADPQEIVAFTLGRLGIAGRGKKLLVTAGRTEEDVDPVRFLTNRSSGRMGFAVAEAGRDRGYAVTVVAGAVSVEPPRGVEVVRVRTAAEMLREVTARHAEHEILVMAAAVADYRPRRTEKTKIPGRQRGLTLDLVPTEDILGSLRGRRVAQVTIGFALETGNELEGAQRKLAEKGLDCIVLNNPTRPGSEFGGETNEVTFLSSDGRVGSLPLDTKRRVAEEILRRGEAILAEKSMHAAAGRRAAGGDPKERATRGPRRASARAKASKGPRTGSRRRAR